MTNPPLREKDRVVLKKIKEGYDDIQKITSETTLENHEVNYCFQKLEKYGFIEVEDRDGFVERVVDGQTRVFRAPKYANLTREALEYLKGYPVQSDEYQDMNREELVRRVRTLESRVSDLEQSLELLKTQIRERL